MNDLVRFLKLWKRHKGKGYIPTLFISPCWGCSEKHYGFAYHRVVSTDFLSHQYFIWTLGQN